ncbi:unnamed protein product [Caenorhabditis nigoni]
MIPSVCKSWRATLIANSERSGLMCCFVFVGSSQINLSITGNEMIEVDWRLTKLEIRKVFNGFSYVMTAVMETYQGTEKSGKKLKLM